MNTEINPIETTIQHYSNILGLEAPWYVTHIERQDEEQRILIHIGHQKGHKAPCPVCATLCPKEDTREQRLWRHMDVLQYTSFIVCNTPRIKCVAHGVKTIDTPFADKLTRYTKLFMNHAIHIIQNSKSLTTACEILHIKWRQLMHLQKIAVEKGLVKRNLNNIEYLGIDEKSFLKNHVYITNLVDLKDKRIIEVVPHRTIEATKKALSVLNEKQLQSVQAVCMDMWDPFKKAVEETCTKATIVHDKFHTVGYITKAVDMVRKKENKELIAKQIETLVSTKYLWLKNTENFTEKEEVKWKLLENLNLKVNKAWALKELFRDFWNHVDTPSAEFFFKKWYFKATHSRMSDMIKAAKTLKRHLPGLLAYITFRITNGLTECFNTTIQSIKANARGFRNFENYRIRILFALGKLDLLA